jgi:chemotaxis protein histidine kinase CheA
MRGAVGGHASPAPPAPAPARGTEPQAESEATAREEAERERSAALERETREREAQEREAQEAREREAREAEERAAQEAREREAREAEEREAREAAARAPREAAAREAEEHARRPTDDTEQPPADRRAWRAPAIAAALLVLAGVAGFLAGRAGDEQETAPQQSSQVSAGPVSATVPPGWSRSEEPTAGGLAIRRPFLTATAPDGARLNAGLLEAGSGLLYPARVAAEALRSPSRPRSVTAGQADGWRFDGRTRRGTRPATLFLLPGSSGLLAVLCSGPEASLPGCQSAAATVEARGSRPVSPVSLTRYARRASRILGALSSARGRDRRALRRAPLRRTQARVSRRLARSFEGAARGLRPRVPAAVRGPISQLTAALQRAARGYAALGRATARTDRRAYRRAAQMIEAAEADVRRAEARL